VPVNIQIARIDTNCAVTQQVARHYPAAIVAHARGTESAATPWRKVGAGEYERLIATSPTTETARVWTQAGKLTWVELRSRDALGVRRATYCYRYGGTLARVVQFRANEATGVDRARAVYLDEHGHVLARGTAVADRRSGPQLYPTVRSLPFYDLVRPR
jgi:hypothetical protein